MDPYEFGWIEEGSRVLVSSSPHLELYHECSQLQWNPSIHPLWQGKVGYVSEKDPDDDVALVKFFYWETNKLAEILVQYHCRGLQQVPKLYLRDGDKPVLGRFDKRRFNGTMYFNMVTLKVKPSEGNETVYSLKSPNSSPFDWTESRFPEDVLLPVYFGRTKKSVLCDKNHRETSGISSTRVIYGSLEGPPGTELIHSLKTWAKHDGCLFRLAIQSFPEQVNEMVEGRTPLMVAVEESIWSATVILISFSAQREVVDEKHNTLLHLAAAKGDVHILEGLLGLGLERDIHKVNLDGETPLHMAVREQNAACVDRLLCVSNIHSNIANNVGETVLHIVCAVLENTSTLTILSRILGNHRLNPTMINANGWTALHLAVMRGNVKCVESMIMSRPNLLNSSVPPPLILAAMHGKSKIVDVILALKRDYAVELQALPDGKTALHMAVGIWHGDVDDSVARLACVQSLITSGAPLMAVDNAGQTACHLLVKYMSANPKPLDRMALTNALQCQKATMKLDEMAAKLRPHWQLACLCFLATRGCELTAVDSQGQTAIDLCTDEKLKDTLQIMVQNRLKCCLPMAAPAIEFDSSDVHMCTFNCEDSVADVQFIPCGHRVMCLQCATTTPLRRCPMCYGNIASAVDLNGSTVEMGLALKARQQVDDERQKMSEEAAKKAKEEAQIEKKKEIEALKEALEKLEMETSCAICLDARPSIVFQCGHTSCAECSEAIKICHICRVPIKEKKTIYT